MIYRFIIFFVLNFAALAIGSSFTGKGVTSEWYAALSKAPWTPPGWFFGVAWTSIMICFSFFMAYGTKEVKNINFFILLFSVQWILNVSWNPTFFYYQNVQLGLIVISALTLLIAWMFVRYWPELKLKTLFLLPYLIWMIIATSLNAYILVKN